MPEADKNPRIPITGTELVWEGKYDKDGNKVAPLRVSLPFWTVETVNVRSGAPTGDGNL